MSLKSLEAAILAELRKVVGNAKLRQKDIMEWSTSEIKAQDGETLVRLPGMGVWVSYKTPKVAP